METLSSSDCLHLWERGQGLHRVDQGVLALRAALPGASWDGLFDLPLGQRNHALVKLRAACFGGRMAGLVSCPECGERLEFELDCQTLATSPAGDQDQLLSVGGRSYRLPSSRDLARAAQESDPRLAAQRLIECCIIGGDGVPELREQEIDEVGEQMALADPAAETLLSLECAHCNHAWKEPLDIVSFLWTELGVRAQRLLLDVHALASAYGWSEGEILSLGEQRRATYLELVRA